jgi:peptide/nickel transport system substrate-binding protein
MVLAVLSAGCSAPQSTSSGSIPNSQPGPIRILVIAERFEVVYLSPKIQGSSSPINTTRLFNAALVMFDNVGAPRPYVAEALPQLNTSSWLVLPDGRMETTYTLRTALTWQDGTPLTAQDFAFALRVYKDSGLGVFLTAPQGTIDAIQTPDPRSVVVQWRSLNPDAGILSFGDLDPLPSQLMESAFNDYEQGRASRETFLGNPAWSTEYVGAGPYRLSHWEPGAQLEGIAFDGHVLGRPKIDRIVLRIIGDENTVLAAVLAGGQVDYTEFFTLRVEHIPVLRREWEAAGKGAVAAGPSSAVALHVQQRPDYVGDPGWLDLRVRRAIAHSLDRAALNEGLFNGIGFPTETIVSPTESIYPDVDRAMTKYPYDPNRAVQLMGEAGYTRDTEGQFVAPDGNRFRLDFSVTAGPEFERGQAILSDSWRRTGFDVHPAILAAAQARDVQSRSTFPGLSSRGGGLAEVHFTAAEVGSPANGWAGDNRSGWTNPNYERLWSAANATLDRAERARDSAQMLALVTENLPIYPLYFAIQVRTRVTGLQGPDDEALVTGFGLASKGTTSHWNIYEWQFN